MLLPPGVICSGRVGNEAVRVKERNILIVGDTE
jgi:hypothetical protein